MHSSAALVLAMALSLAAAQSETVLGVYMFHRHGDRTPKVLAPANLTTLGYQQVYTSGEYYRNRYIASDASLKINGINSDIVKQSQIAVSAPDDTVLQNSAAGFLQALYPAVVTTETLRDGRQVSAPMNGYQLIPVEEVQQGSGSEDNSWLQSAQGCAAATINSNNFYSSQEYTGLLSSTADFYKSLLPVINSTFTASQANYKNAYTIFDYLNVANIHNTTIPSSELLTPSTILKLQDLANSHEWGLAYNGTSDMRSVAGKVLAGEILQTLNKTASSPSTAPPKISIQFGAYATFGSFFGLASLPAVNQNFTGIVDYASSMVFELFTNSSSSSSSTNSSDMYVRFLFHNGTASNTSEPAVYPLFGSGKNVLPWNEFETGMKGFALGSTSQWCTACGNTTGVCAGTSDSEASGGDVSGQQSGSQGSGSGNGMSPAVNGVIGAMVTLAVVFGLEALVVLVGGLRVVKKNRIGAGNGNGAVGEGAVKA